jgi:hypothetical protein
MSQSLKVGRILYKIYYADAPRQDLDDIVDNNISDVLYHRRNSSKISLGMIKRKEKSAVKVHILFLPTSFGIIYRTWQLDFYDWLNVVFLPKLGISR